MIFGTTFTDWSSLTPVTHERIDSIGSLVVRDGVDISVSPSTRLNGFEFIIRRLNFKLLHEVGESHRERGRYSTLR